MFKLMVFNISFVMVGLLILVLMLILVLVVLVLKFKEEKDMCLVVFLKWYYVIVLVWVLEWCKLVLGIVVGVLIGSFVLFLFLGKEFMFNLKEGVIMWCIILIFLVLLDELINIFK